MLRRIPFAVFLFCCLSLAAADEGAALPKAKDFQKHVLALMKSYKSDGTHSYHWPRGSSWKGTTCDLVYGGTTVAKGDPKGRCFCCGLTFEVFFRAWQRWSKAHKRPFKIRDLDAPGVRKLILAWFGSSAEQTCSLAAVLKFKLGSHIKKLEKAKPGDFVQFWRHSGSGHSVIFVAWERDRKGAIVGLRYWSTQRKTKGIGVNMERIGPKGIIRNRIHIARIGR